MPIAPGKPMQWVCSQCTWKHQGVIKSDVLMPKPDKCPKCGSEVVLKEAGLFSLLKSHLT